MVGSAPVDPMITSSAGTLFVLAANAGAWFWIEKRTGWGIFNFFPPLIFIDRKGAEALSYKGIVDIDESSYRPGRKKLKTYLLPHRVEIVEFRLRLNLAARQHAGKELEWLHTHELVDLHTKDATGKKIKIKPDGMLRFGDNKHRDWYCFIEIDQGNHPYKRIAEKARGYVEFLETGAFKKVMPQAFSVIYVAPTIKRAQSILKTVEKEGGRNMFWATDTASTETETILSKPVWHRAKSKKMHQLFAKPRPR